MPCYRPLKAWKSRELHESGKQKITFKRSQGQGEKLELPCGQCVGCRLERSRQWAVRCLHESKQHEHNCMITLTYENQYLPKNGSLSKRDMQLFIKRLRKHSGTTKIRYIYCGEYGDQFNRPHYHMCLFGYDFNDKKPCRETTDGTHYTSEQLQNLWGKGRCELTQLNFKTAAYVARYVTKKVNGRWAKHHYDGLEPEFLEASRRPGIGSKHYDEFKNDIYPSDEVIINGQKVKPPRFYDKKYEKEGGDITKLKENRLALAKLRKEHQTPERLKVREKIKNLHLKKQLKRRYENENNSGNI